MAWTQVYDPVVNEVVSACIAAIPLVILLYMLAIKRSKGHVAALAGLASAFLIAILVWKMPIVTAVSSVTLGIANGLFPIIWIVITAVWVYNMTVESGEFEIIKDSLARVTPDRRLQTIFIAFAFGSFLEGTAGFGTPVAITAAMLAGLGFNPIYGAGLCLIANTAPVAFGAIGAPVLTAASVSGMDANLISQVAARQLPILAIIVPFWLSIVMCGFRRSLEILPAILVAGICFAGSQFIFANYHGPTLPDIMSAIATIVGLLVLLRFWKPSNIFRFAEDPAVSTDGPGYSGKVVLRAWGPYLILAVMVFFWGLPQFKAVLNGISCPSIAWPLLNGMVNRAAPIVPTEAVYAAKFTFNWVSAGGTAILLSGFIAVPMMPGYSYRKAVKCFFTTLYQLRFPVLTIASVLGLAFLMNYAGMSSTLGLAFTKTGSFFPFFAPLIGWLGVFLTGSDTSSNALFCSMQHTTATAVGIPPELAVASNAVGGVTGKMISPQSISVATSATNMVGQEGNLFRFALGHSIALTLILCVLVYFQAGFLSWMLP
jgi:lactate permease